MIFDNRPRVQPGPCNTVIIATLNAVLVWTAIGWLARKQRNQP